MADINPFMLIGAWIIGILVSAYIFRVVFGIEKMLQNQNEIKELLQEISSKLNKE